MPVPLALSIPAVAAGLAYLNARTSFEYDVRLLGGLAKQTLKIRFRERRDRLNVFYILEEWALSPSYADRVFLIYGGKSWTYKQTYEIVLKYGTWLRTRYNVEPRAIVALDYMNSDKFVFIWFGLWSIGACPAFINYNLTGPALLHCVRTSTARLLIVDPEVRPAVTDDLVGQISAPGFHQDSTESVEVVFFTAEVEDELLGLEGVRSPDTTRSGAKISDRAILIYTSGTTGLPKPAIVSWSKPILGGGFSHDWMGWKSTDIFYSSMPLYHSSAAVLGLCAALSAGHTIAIGHTFSTRTFWRDVRESKATMIQYVGETCRYLLAAKPEIDPVSGENLDRKHNVRLAFGNGLRPDVWNRFKERFGIETIAEFYAATEGTSGSWNLSKNDFSVGAIGRNGTFAKLLLGAQLAIVEVDWESEEPWRDPNTGRCKKVATGDAGELLYKLDPNDIGNQFQGYFGNEKASNGKIMRDVLIAGDAYFRTGDVLRWDHEGRWFFNDRIGDTFRWKSENVSTSEVSEAIGHHPCVQEANVYGVSLPHHDGRAGMAALILADPPTPTLMSSLAQHAHKRLPRFAVPQFLRVMHDMQTTGTHKQQKQHLRIEGLDPTRVGKDQLFWLRHGTYQPFGENEWASLNGGAVKL